MIEARSLRLLKTLRPQLIVIDEVHHLLAGNAREQRRALNLLKFLANELRVSLVTIGTTDAPTAMQTDLQIASRFEPLPLPRWSASEEMRGFLAAYVRGLPLREPSEITDNASVNLPLSRSAGITGRITLTIARAAELAIRKGDERISLQWLEQSSRVLDLAPCPA